MGPVDINTINYVQYQNLGEHFHSRCTDICKKALQKYGTVSRFYVMKKLPCDYKQAKIIIERFNNENLLPMSVQTK